MRQHPEPLWREQLELAQVPNGYWPDVYVLGLHAARITFADQQKRAFNLVSALCASGRLRPKDTLGIVGAGIAGITAAAFAAQLGITATVLDQYSEPMMLQQGSNRWIHPNLYDWPWLNWRSTSTRFPCMNWIADTAGEIISRLRREWRQLVVTDAVRWHGATRIVSLLRHGEEWFAVDESGHKYGPWKSVILAVGFGEEEDHLGLDHKPYWHDDDLHQRARNGGKVLVSGCGDGGLIDAIRCLLLDFKHENIARIATMADTDEIGNRLTQVEADRPRYPDGAKLTDAYLQVESPEVDKALSELTRSNLVVTLNSRDDAPLTRASSPLNRFIVARLMRLGRILHVSGNIDVASIARSGATVTVPVNGSPQSFNHVVVRHGPKNPAINVLPEIKSSLVMAKQFFALYPYVVDRTRQPLWQSILPPPKQPQSTAPVASSAPPDVRTVEFIAERAQADLKGNLLHLLPAVLVRREVVGDMINLAVEANNCILGHVSLRVNSDSAVLIAVVSSEGKKIHTETIGPHAGPTHANEVARVLRTASFLLGGKG
ncbi:hypothetical protein F0U59_40720 [Archangium gephyra]|nr:hypothetical protein F0U59_40720 [Archangium gephyra]